MFLPYDSLAICWVLSCRLAVIAQTTDVTRYWNAVISTIPAAVAQALREDLGGSRCWQRYHRATFAGRYANPCHGDRTREDGVFCGKRWVKGLHPTGGR